MQLFNVSDLMAYAEKYIFKSKDRNIISYWYDTKSEDFIDYIQIRKKFGKYDLDLFLAHGLIPFDQFDVLQLAKEYMKSTGIAVFSQPVKYLEGASFERVFYRLLHDNESLSENWFETRKKAMVKTTVGWLEFRVFY